MSFFGEGCVKAITFDHRACCCFLERTIVVSLPTIAKYTNSVTVGLHCTILVRLHGCSLPTRFQIRQTPN